MKRIFLLGLICTAVIGGFEKTYSMSGKRMPERKEVTEVRGKENSLPGKTVVKKEIVTIEPLEQPDIIINKENIEGLYKELAESEGERIVRRYPVNYQGDYYEMYTGERLLVEGGNPSEARLIKFPYMSENQISVSEDGIEFSSYYQGEYQIETEEGFGNIRIIDVKVKHKYNFTEEQNYDIILNSYKNKDYDVFSASKNLFILSYPDSFDIKEVLFMDAELNIEEKKTEEAKKSIEDIRNIYKLTEEEDERLILLEEKTFAEGSKGHREYLYENKDIEPLRKKLVASFNAGDTLNPRDIELLRDEYAKNPTSKIAQLLGEHYLLTESDGEAIRYLTYSKDYEKVADIYLENREFELFEETLERVPAGKRQGLLDKKQRIERSAVVERELNLGRRRFESENYQEAILFFDRAKRRDSKIAVELGVELDLGISYYNLFEYLKAVEHLKRAARTENEYKALEANYYIAMSYYRYHSDLDPEEVKEDSEETAEVVDYSKKSLEYFDKIVKDYPETSWAKKSMIYIIRLRKE